MSASTHRTATTHTDREPTTTLPVPADNGDPEEAETTEMCACCGVQEATRHGPISVNGRIFLNEPLCERCAISDDKLPEFARHAVEELGYSEHFLDDMGLSIYEVSKALGPGAAVRAYSRRHDI